MSATHQMQIRGSSGGRRWATAIVVTDELLVNQLALKAVLKSEADAFDRQHKCKTDSLQFLHPVSGKVEPVEL